MADNSVDQVEVKLPLSKQTAIVRNYTTRADDNAYNDVLFEGVTINDDGTYDLPINNSNHATEVYVRRLTDSINGSTEDIEAKIGELRTEDYAVLEQKVIKIVGLNSPKARADKLSTNPN